MPVAQVAMPGENSNRPVRAETDVTRWLLHKFQAKISCDGDDFHNHVTLIAAVTALGLRLELHHQLSRSSACRQQAVGLLSLHNSSARQDH
ncbi:uncharacterized protein RBU33_013931 isoform 3-T7 [Hipposideros larvatus]